jgi:uncharacterized membrane protein
MISWLSTFMLNPLMAFGAAAVASPILIHILSRRRFRRVRWAAMDFLLAAHKKNRRRIKLEQMILLALRCLAVALLAFMIARPFVRPNSFAALVGASPRTERIILLDDSFSMGYRPPAAARDDAAVFDRSRTAIERIARLIASESPDDTLSVYLTSNPTEPQVAIQSVDDAGIQQLRDRLATLAPSQKAGAMPRALDAVAQSLLRSASQVNAAVYIISDFQRRDWVRPRDVESGEPPPSPLAPLGRAAREGRDVKIVLIHVGPKDAGNVAVTSVEAVQPQAVAGVPVRFEVGVSNLSNAALENVELGVSVARHRLPPIVVPRIAPNQTVREPVEITFPTDGSDYVQVELAGAALAADGLALDNRRAAAVEVLPALRVLLVDGEPSNDAYRDEAYLFKTALRPAGRVASGNEITVVDEQELNDIELAPYHLVVMANVPRLERAALSNVEAFVADGGGLLMFAGDQVDIAHYNDMLFRKGQGVLPAALVDFATPPPGAEGFAIGSWDAGHPVMRSFVAPLDELLRQVHVFALLSVELPESSTTNVASTTANAAAPGNGPDAKDLAATSPVRVVVSLNDDDGQPLILQKQFGRGQCVFVATSMDQEWNDWASNFSYLPMMLQLVQNTARRADTAGQTVAGGELSCPIDVARFKPQAALRTPGYPLEPELGIEAQSSDAGVATLRHADAKTVGLYRFELTANTGERAERFAVVNPDASECDLATCTQEQLASALGDKPAYEFVADVRVLTDEAASARRELWWPLLIAAVVALMTEQWLAWYFGSRAHV